MASRRLAVLTASALLAGLSACAGGHDGPRTAARRTPTTSTTASASTIPPASTAPATTAAPAPTSVAAAGPPPSCPPVPARVAPAADRPRYVVSADVHLDRNTVDGNLTVRFTPDLDTDRLVFRLWPNAPREAAAGARLDTGPVTVGAHPAPAALSDPTTLVVRPPGTLRANEPVEVALPWRLTLPGEVNDRVSRTGDAVRLGSFVPILSWEPGVGWDTEPPTGGYAEAASSPTADFSYTVSVPAGLGVLATGVPDGQGRWRADAVRDIALSVGRFAVATGVAHAPDPVQVTVGVAAGIAESPERYLAKEIRVLEDFGHRFGPYPWPAFTLAITPGLTGGIEFPGHVMQGPGHIGRTTSHEVAHQWFYGLVGNDQGRDPWLDEGLATYGEARFEGTLGSVVARAVPADARAHLGEPMTYWEQHQSSYYAGVYVQGAQALAALGDPALVDCALRVFVAANAYRIARPRDLIAALSAVFPDAPAVATRFGVHG